MDKRFVHFATVSGGSPSTEDLEIEAGKTIIIRMIDFSGPGGQSYMKVILDPDGSPEAIAASRSDKCCVIPDAGLTIQGPNTVRSELNLIGGGNTEMGVVIHYELL